MTPPRPGRKSNLTTGRLTTPLGAHHPPSDALTTDPVPDPATGPQDTVAQRFALIREPNFRRMWIIGGASMGLQWLEMLAGGIFVFVYTQSGVAVTLVTLARAAPMVIFGMVAGGLADRVSRRNLLVGGYSMLIGTAAVLGILAATHAITPWHVGIGMFLTGVVFSMEFPVRRNMLGEFAGMDRIATAMGLDSIARNGMRIVGPLAAGALMQFVGIEGVYFVSMATYACIVYMLLRVDNRPARSDAGGPSLMSTIIEGVRFARSDRAVLGLLAITIVMNIWAFPYIAMIPVLGHERLGLTELPIGILAATEGFGGLMGAFLIAARGTAWAGVYRKLYFYGSCVFMVAIVGFSLSLWFEVSLFILLLGGIGVAGFSTMQGTLPFVVAPPAMRARVLGLLSVSIGTGPIGILHLGLMVTLFGPSLATTIIGLEGLIAMAILWVWIKEVR